MNYFAARLVRQFKARGAYPSVLPTFPALGLNLQQELKGKGWVGAWGWRKPLRPSRERELLLSPWVVVRSTFESL